ncbi:hypothetical protein Rhow_000990 [Rhodococcus wratislaviensis]|uniref:Uncharacterized protein n=1 Tax=Rhodococcus wratislaviensis TaxID=44752 RepID=A0A402C386_RHOWR|nr:hypothetical protein Rhow_000990 [Rhodococcus wratislaviensis]
MALLVDKIIELRVHSISSEAITQACHRHDCAPDFLRRIGSCKTRGKRRNTPLT